MEDEGKALHYFNECTGYPADMTVLSWLGAFHVRCESYEKATPFFNRRRFSGGGQVAAHGGELRA